MHFLYPYPTFMVCNIRVQTILFIIRATRYILNTHIILHLQYRKKVLGITHIQMRIIMTFILYYIDYCIRFTDAEHQYIILFKYIYYYIIYNNNNSNYYYFLLYLCGLIYESSYLIFVCLYISHHK